LINHFLTRYLAHRYHKHPFLEKAKPNALNPLIATCLYLKQQRKALAAGDVQLPKKLLAATLQKPRGGLEWLLLDMFIDGVISSVVPKLERTSSRSMVVSSSASSGPKPVSKANLFAPSPRASLFQYLFFLILSLILCRTGTLSSEKYEGIIIDDSDFEFNEEDAPLNFSQEAKTNSSR